MDHEQRIDKPATWELPGVRVSLQQFGPAEVPAIENSLGLGSVSSNSACDVHAPIRVGVLLGKDSPIDPAFLVANTYVLLQRVHGEHPVGPPARMKVADLAVSPTDLEPAQYYVTLACERPKWLPTAQELPLCPAGALPMPELTNGWLRDIPSFPGPVEAGTLLAGTDGHAPIGATGDVEGGVGAWSICSWLKVC